MVKEGKYIGTLDKPNKVAVMGFSFGSYITHDAICKTPDLADAVILTAFGPNLPTVNAGGLVRSFAPRIAKIENEKLWGSYDAGYLTSAGIYAEFLK
jgi:pimeloyl-ACP methyl ester carboxylesterase